jgi:hypothetical protein
MEEKAEVCHMSAKIQPACIDQTSE